MTRQEAWEQLKEVNDLLTMAEEMVEACHGLFQLAAKNLEAACVEEKVMGMEGSTEGAKVQEEGEAVLGTGALVDPLEKFWEALP